MQFSQPTQFFRVGPDDVMAVSVTPHVQPLSFYTIFGLVQKARFLGNSADPERGCPGG
jgi:hypothetical protein